MRGQRDLMKMENWIGSLLLAGVLLSVLLLSAGLLWRWSQGSRLSVEYSLGTHSLAGFWMQEFRAIARHEFRPRLVINLGLVVLLMTPYVRVVTSFLFFFLVERNFKYSCFTFFVWCILTYTLFLH